MSKRQEMREKRAKQQKTQRILIGSFILLGALLVTLAVILPGMNQPEIASGELKARPQADENRMGDPNAPITITVYSDYKCGHCAAFARETEPQLVDQYISTGKVYFIYRSMGAWSPESLLAIEGSYCAGDENKFWEFHDLLFYNQTSTFNNALMEQFAKELGLNETEFKSCLATGKYRDRANQDGIDGTALGVKGTPTFIINYMVNGQERQRVLPGNYPLSGFQQEIEAALDEMGL